MPDNVITPESLGFIGGFSIKPPEPIETKDESTTDKPADKSVDKSDTKVDTKPEAKTPSLAEILRADREARTNKETNNKETLTLKEEVTKLRNELNTVKASTAFEDDPIAYCRSRKLSPEAQIALGETLIYDLAPDKAPPDLRFRLFENKTKREKAEQELRNKEEQSKRDLELVNQHIDGFARSLENAARSFGADAYPESQDWFTSSDNVFDDKTYVQSLMFTAENIAKTATANGQVADLSPANIAKQLETEIARRMSLRDNRRSKRNTTKTETTKSPQVNTETKVEIESSKGLNSGPPDKSSYDEDERVRRASRVLFKS